MPLSANTLIHLTKSKQNLKDILSEFFKIYYCKEEVAINGINQILYVPMVSFCDIPLSEIKIHISKYGNYGLGMTKEWGVRNGLNPVLYISSNSAMAKSFHGVVGHFKMQKKLNQSGLALPVRELFNISRFFKNYEGDLKRENYKTKKKYRYSDEREWRFVPPYSDKYKTIFVGKPNDSDLKKSELELSKCRLRFDPKDIKYIFIKSESEIQEFIAHLKSGMFGSTHEVERLITRLLTTKQIKDDI